ncbi:MAG: OmpH family outer membrane protein [Candidatus Marinimicrobia bacterium]|nr:OmpH family outer membrane protein [Candidatus Neomarinimicrobiota bacterium]
MIKHKVTNILIVVGWLLPTAIFGQIKIGYIDSNRIMQEFEEVRDAQAKLEKETRRLQAEYTTYVGRLDSLQREFERQRLLLSNDKIRDKEREIQTLYQTTQAFQQEKFGPEGELYRYQATLMSPILEKIDAAVKVVGAERGYDFIMDAAGGALVYALPAYDLTTDVVTELRRATRN